ncbi:transcriptional regulator, partial [Actinoplanes sp. NPDC048791]
MSAAPNLSTVFVELADTLHETFEVSDFLQVLVDRCVTLLPVTAAGLLLADHRGEPQVVAATSLGAQLILAAQVRFGRGPGFDCHRVGTPVSAPDKPRADPDPRPRVAHHAPRAGISAEHVFP